VYVFYTGVLYIPYRVFTVYAFYRGGDLYTEGVSIVGGTYPMGIMVYAL